MLLLLLQTTTMVVSDGDDVLLEVKLRAKVVEEPREQLPDL
jgi:hypothetical protein